MKKVILSLFVFLFFNLSYSDNHTYDGWDEFLTTKYWFTRGVTKSVKNNKMILSLWLKRIYPELDGGYIISLTEVECPHNDKNGKEITPMDKRRHRHLQLAMFDSKGKVLKNNQHPTNWEYVFPSSDLDYISSFFCFFALDDTTIERFKSNPQEAKEYMDFIEKLFGVK